MDEKTTNKSLDPGIHLSDYQCFEGFITPDNDKCWPLRCIRMDKMGNCLIEKGQELDQPYSLGTGLDGRRDNAVIPVGSDTDYHDDDDADLFCGRKNWTQRTSLGPTAASSGDGVKCRNLPAQSPMSSRAKQAAAAAADMASKTWSSLSLLRTKHFTLLLKNLGKKSPYTAIIP
ncbi:unnamed protein product [Fusarium fujikuroi]|uniref:Uncharacterized protein n=1 Tax=Fusarium fujikuroi TaxID=5127 RepID=A0A9Q9RVV3_FUSFU|nr:unnamed protein product [Fusarium fujikuroi]VTT77083.1 unnamed protein product [Fusarium fujikuroi]